jgi:hypothetical protein
MQLRNGAADSTNDKRRFSRALESLQAGSGFSMLPVARRNLVASLSM